MKTQSLKMALLMAPSLLAFACSGPQEPLNTCKDPEIAGLRSSLTLVSTDLDGVQVGEPVQCDGKPDTYVRLNGDGWRQIVMGRGEFNGYAGCAPDAALSGAPEDCPAIQFDLFGVVLAERIVARGGNPGGVGLGVCGDINGEYDEWNPSLTVVDWSHADLAIEEAAKLMKELQIGNHFGISVTHPLCGVALEAHD